MSACSATAQVDLNSVGQAAPGIEVKIADGGEVLVQAASVGAQGVLQAARTPRPR
jgi:long-subunit acyl-CoA synthetase (AMP-forming)